MFFPSGKLMLNLSRPGERTSLKGESTSQPVNALALASHQIAVELQSGPRRRKERSWQLQSFRSRSPASQRQPIKGVPPTRPFISRVPQRTPRFCLSPRSATADSISSAAQHLQRSPPQNPLAAAPRPRPTVSSPRSSRRLRARLSVKPSNSSTATPLLLPLRPRSSPCPCNSKARPA